MFKKLILPIITAAVFLTAGCSNQAEPGREQLETSIKNILEMPTCEHIYRDIIYIGEEEKFLFFTTVDKRLLFAIDIRLVAGISDTSEISIEMERAPDGRRSAAVSLPKASVLYADADEKSIRQFFIKEFGREISLLDYYDEIDRKKQELLASEDTENLLKRADSNAENLISSFLKLSGIDDVRFRRRDG